MDRGIENYVERCRKRIPSFVAENFSLEQAWNLQRPTLWRDLACSPVNAAWAPPHLAVHKAAESAEKVGSSHAGLAKRLPTGIKTGYQRQIEQRICRDLLEWDREASPAFLPQGFLRRARCRPFAAKADRGVDHRVPARALIRTC